VATTKDLSEVTRRHVGSYASKKWLELIIFFDQLGSLRLGRGVRGFAENAGSTRTHVNPWRFLKRCENCDLVNERT
jgi:hypothetical protein